jgi:hypothetical protein
MRRGFAADMCCRAGPRIRTSLLDKARTDGIALKSVMDAHDAVTDLTLEVVADGRLVTWAQVRELSLRFLNEVRKDIGIGNEPITYHGTR